MSTIQYRTQVQTVILFVYLYAIRIQETTPLITHNNQEVMTEDELLFILYGDRYH
jgi:hypothetical protein